MKLWKKWPSTEFTQTAPVWSFILRASDGDMRKAFKELPVTPALRRACLAAAVTSSGHISGLAPTSFKCVAQRASELCQET